MSHIDEEFQENLAIIKFAVSYFSKVNLIHKTYDVYCLETKIKEIEKNPFEYNYTNLVDEILGNFYGLENNFIQNLIRSFYVSEGH